MVVMQWHWQTLHPALSLAMPGSSSVASSPEALNLSKFPCELGSTSWRLLSITGILRWHLEWWILSRILTILFIQFLRGITVYAWWSFPKYIPQILRLGCPKLWAAGAYFITMCWAYVLLCTSELTRYYCHWVVIFWMEFVYCWD